MLKHMYPTKSKAERSVSVVEMSSPTVPPPVRVIVGYHHSRRAEQRLFIRRGSMTAVLTVPSQILAQSISFAVVEHHQINPLDIDTDIKISWYLQIFQRIEALPSPFFEIAIFR